jgi:hypothetical protein
VRNFSRSFGGRERIKEDFKLLLGGAGERILEVEVEREGLADVRISGTAVPLPLLLSTLFVVVCHGLSEQLSLANLQVLLQDVQPRKLCIVLATGVFRLFNLGHKFGLIALKIIPLGTRDTKNVANATRTSTVTALFVILSNTAFEPVLLASRTREYHRACGIDQIS